MKERVPVWLVALALLAARGESHFHHGLLASVGGRAEPTREDSGPRPATAQRRPAPPDDDLLEIRDIFRYADEPRIAPTPSGGGSQGALESDAAPPQRTRLIGLVQRSDRLVAAVSIDGEVLLLAAGESALGFTVLDIREETVRLRDPNGDVEALELQ